MFLKDVIDPIRILNCIKKYWIHNECTDCISSMKIICNVFEYMENYNCVVELY